MLMMNSDTSHWIKKILGNMLLVFMFDWEFHWITDIPLDD